jgi:hypothetical protein
VSEFWADVVSKCYAVIVILKHFKNINISPETPEVSKLDHVKYMDDIGMQTEGD